MTEGERVDPATIPDIVDVGSVHKGVEGGLRNAVAGLARFFGDKALAAKVAPRVTIEVESGAAVARRELQEWARQLDIQAQIELGDGSSGVDDSGIQFTSPVYDQGV